MLVPRIDANLELLAYAGDRHVYGFQGRIMGALDRRKPASRTVKKKNAAKTKKKGGRK